MSMTREEAIDVVERYRNVISKVENTEYTVEALDVALTALRPVSREQVERVWRGEIQEEENYFLHLCKCPHCDLYIGPWSINRPYIFCPYCGEAFTDEAVEMVMERLEKLYEAN